MRGALAHTAGLDTAVTLARFIHDYEDTKSLFC